MKQLLFSPAGRINRALFWKATILILAFNLVAGVLLLVLGGMIPNQTTTQGVYNVTGVAALPYVVVIFGATIASVWAGICVGVKRYHDRNKSGVWLLIQVIPVIGVIWNFIETGCLEGTIGPNQYGPDPIARAGGVAATPYAVAP